MLHVGCTASTSQLFTARLGGVEDPNAILTLRRGESYVRPQAGRMGLRPKGCRWRKRQRALSQVAAAAIALRKGGLLASFRRLGGGRKSVAMCVSHVKRPSRKTIVPVKNS